MSFWDIVWFIIISFAFVAYLMVLFAIVGDLFRDSETSGVAKAIWIFCLIFFPFITALVYFIVRGQGMASRAARQATTVKEIGRASCRERGWNSVGEASVRNE